MTEPKTQTNPKSTFFKQQILIAMPTLNDSRFEKTVIYIANDDSTGTVGLVLNQPHKLNMEQLLSHFDLNKDMDPTVANQSVLMGGPQEVEHGFILHQGAAVWEKSSQLDHGLSMTVSEDILKALAKGEGPKKFIATLGYAGWEVGQLSREIQRNSWITIPHNEALLFDVGIEDMWTVALNTLGIAAESLSTEAGYDC